MPLPYLFIWVEGNDDERFFETVINPRLKEKYCCIQIIKYATMKDDKIKSFIRSIISMDAEYIFTGDLNNSPCITERINHISSRYCLQDNNVISIIIKEIESWYVAGIDETNKRRLKLKRRINANELTKEQFNELIPRKFTSRIDFMIELLKVYKCRVASINNDSFQYFSDKYFLQS